MGSSPRGRGKLGEVDLAARCGRLIPAWAGKTTVLLAVIVPIPAHPRVGGENNVAWIGVASPGGSSPRGRGKRGIMDMSLSPFLAHPRVGGENAHPLRVVCSDRGSSPRGRGKHSRVGREGRVHGLIPAWAGKTGAGCRGRPRHSAHPRVGGENIVDKPNILAGLGSSPRGRGKRLSRTVTAP